MELNVAALLTTSLPRTLGAGKSTLMSALVGCVAVREGRVAIRPGLRVGYLEQTAVSGAKTTVREEVASRMAALQAATR